MERGSTFLLLLVCHVPDIFVSFILSICLDPRGDQVASGQYFASLLNSAFFFLLHFSSPEKMKYK